MLRISSWKSPETRGFPDSYVSRNLTDESGVHLFKDVCVGCLGSGLLKSKDFWMLQPESKPPGSLGHE